MKPLIVDEFTRENSSLRVLIATIAFGMGLNCCNVQFIGVHPMTLNHTFKRRVEEGGMDYIQTLLFIIKQQI